MKKFLIIFLLTILFTALSLTTIFLVLNRPVNPDGQDILFTVDQGETLNTVAEKLEQRKLIRSSLLPRVWTRLTGFQNKIKSGTFIVNSNMTTLEVMSALVNGKQVLYKVTIPEGYTLSKIASIMQLERICSSDDFLDAAANKALLEQLGIPGDSVEGYLFPDTYMFPHNYPAEQVISYMVDTFWNKLGQIYPGYESLDISEIYNKVKLASIVEREYRIPEEAPLMASVFNNRLTINYKLESCATVVYILTEVLGRDNPEGAITFADTRIDSRFNTYRNIGLPPAPISNPGQVALDAVFHPAETDYMFFRIIDPVAGRHKFTRTYQEHLNAYQFSIKAY